MDDDWKKINPLSPLFVTGDRADREYFDRVGTGRGCEGRVRIGIPQWALTNRQNPKDLAGGGRGANRENTSGSDKQRGTGMVDELDP